MGDLKSQPITNFKGLHVQLYVLLLYMLKFGLNVIILWFGYELGVN